MKKMVLNKKGQGLPTSTLVIMIIAIIVLVFVVLGFTTGWGYIFDKLGLLPDDLTAASQACEQYAGSEALKISYCEYRELRLEGVKGYYNCDDVRTAAENTIGENAVKWPAVSCQPVDLDSFCSTRKLKEGTVVGTGSCPAAA